MIKNINKNTTHINNNTKTTKNNKISAKKIRNWSGYNKSLVEPGNLSVFISDSLIKDGHLVMPPRTGRVGRPTEYTDELIEFILTIRELFHLPLRQVTDSSTLFRTIFLEYLFS